MFKRGVLRGRKLMLQDTAGEWIELKRAAKYYEENFKKIINENMEIDWVVRYSYGSFST